MTPAGMPYDLRAKCCWDGNLLHVELPEAPSAIHVHHPNGSVYFGVPTRVENELWDENRRLWQTLSAALIRLSAANEAAGGGFADARFCDELRELGIEVD